MKCIKHYKLEIPNFKGPISAKVQTLNVIISASDLKENCATLVFQTVDHSVLLQILVYNRASSKAV